MSLRQLANDASLVLDCIRTGKIDEETYTTMQNIKDELESLAIRYENESNATTDNENV